MYQFSTLEENKNENKTSEIERQSCAIVYNINLYNNLYDINNHYLIQQLSSPKNLPIILHYLNDENKWAVTRK